MKVVQFEINVLMVQDPLMNCWQLHAAGHNITYYRTRRAIVATMKAHHYGPVLFVQPIFHSKLILHLGVVSDLILWHLPA
jgi:hypothetical protein